MDADWALERKGRKPRPLLFTLRSLLGPGLRLPAVSGGGAVVVRSFVIEGEAFQAQGSRCVACGVELACQAVARAHVLKRRVATRRDRPVVGEREAEIGLDR